MLTPVLLAAEPIKLFVTIDNDIQRQLDALVIPAVNNLTGALQTTALLGGTLYILIIGLTIVLGADSTPFYTFLKTSSKIAFVAALSLSSEGYLGGVMGALRGLESGLLQVFSLNPNSSGPGGGLPFQLDQMMSIGFEKLVECFALADSYGALSPGAALAWVAAGLIFAFATAVLAIFGGAITILVQFALAILFALGPLFVLCLMFPQTSGFFDKWLGEVLSFLLQNVVVAIVLSFALNIFLTFIERAKLEKEGPSPWTAAMQVFVVGLVMVYFLWKSGPMVAGLAGGMGSSIISAAGAAQMSGSLGKGAAGAAKAAGGAAAGLAKRAAALPKQALGAGMKAAGGMSKVASRLAAFGKSSSLGASSGASDKLSAASSSPSSSGAAKNAVASSSASSPVNASSSSSRAGSLKERKAAKLGARELRSRAIGNFANESASKPRASAESASTPRTVASASSPKPSAKSEKGSAPTFDKPKETR